MTVDTEKLADIAIRGRGFDNQAGGFTHILVGARSYTKAEVVAALRRVAEPVGRVECTSTHCERRQECAAPHECSGNAVGKAMAYAVLRDEADAAAMVTDADRQAAAG